VRCFRVLAPAHMPAELVARIERDTTEVLKDPAVQVKLVELGFEPAPAPASRLAAMMDEEFVVWREAINRLGLKLN
jgi:tripartite-type tricarboxylate transporter receptor subunit TctC